MSVTHRFDFSDRLRMAITAHGYASVRQLELRAGLGAKSVGRILRRVRRPTQDTLERLLRVLPDVDARWLITGTPAKTKATTETQP